MVIIVAIAAIVALVLLAGGGGGPRITHIETRREEEDKDGDRDA